MDLGPSSHIVADNHDRTALTYQAVQTQLEAHEKALAVLNAERAQLTKQVETLKAERQVLEAVARKLAKTRRSGSA